MLDQPLKYIAAALREKKISSRELTESALANAEVSQNTLNAFITLTPEAALAAADVADRSLAAGDAHPLCGIPLAHKDIFCTEGILTTCGSKMLANFVSPYNATVVEKLNSAGVVSIGKTNMDEFAMGSTNETSYFGAAKNPWDTRCVPGGSSGGSAAAVAGGVVPVATGTDTGGSVRQPAAFCGITGIKPTYGRVSRFGMVAFASSLDQGGAFARSAEDAAVLLEAMSGFDERDSTSLNAEVPDFSTALGQSLEGMKIGLPRQYFSDSLSPEIASAIDAARLEFERLGAKIIEVGLPNSELAIPCYYIIAPAEASSNLSRFDGVRYGHRAAEYDDLISMYENTRAEGFGDEVKRRIMIGTYALSSGYYDAYYIQAQKLRRLIADDFAQAFTQCDVILGPTTPHPPLTLGATVDDPVSLYLEDIYTVSANLAGLPGISVPAGFSSDDLPIGMQLLAPPMQEARLLNVAHQYQQVTDFHLQRPAGFGGAA